MPLLDRGRAPSPAELRFFGVVLAALAGIVGGLVLYLSGSWRVAAVIWGVGAILCATYYALPPTRQLLFRGWMALVFPMGWAVSHLLMAAIYYVVITPIGLLVRLFGHDPLQRSLSRSAASYWKPFQTPDRSDRYFEQY